MNDNGDTLTLQQLLVREVEVEVEDGGLYLVLIEVVIQVVVVEIIGINSA